MDKDRIQEFCRYCGSPTELAAYADGRLESDPDETLQFSSQYCSLHRPKLPDGGWNPGTKGPPLSSTRSWNVHHLVERSTAQ